jgi:pyruvate kinase
MLRAGATGLRIIAKGFQTTDDICDYLQRVNVAASSLGGLQLMLDLPAARPTIGRIDQPVNIVKGREYTLYDETDIHAPVGIPVAGIGQHFSELVAGDILEIADGRLCLEVIRQGTAAVSCIASNDFLLMPHRSIRSRRWKSYPLSVDACGILKRDLSEFGVRSVALSFVEGTDLIEQVRSACVHWLVSPRLVAKIESMSGVSNVGAIARAADGVMIARGDLSFLAGPEGFTCALVRLLEGLRDFSSVSVATGLLRTMVDSTEPSISDMSDVVHWCRLGVREFVLSDFDDVPTTCRALQWFDKQAKST